jgi:hypothetical protein
MNVWRRQCQVNFSRPSAFGEAGRFHGRLKPTPRTPLVEYESCINAAGTERGEDGRDSRVHGDVPSLPMLAVRNRDDSIPEIDELPCESILFAASHAGVQANLKLWQVLGTVTLNYCAQGNFLTVAQIA